jgi:ribosomal-protein-alanine N-acetyltransferase
MMIPHLSSLRLTLRPYEEADFEVFAVLSADINVRQHVGGPLNREGAARLFERFISGDSASESEAWAAVDKNSGDYIGHCWFVHNETGCPEMGFLVAARFWRRGYGTEIAQTLIEYARCEAGYQKIIATVDCDHIASIRILERVGMKRERIERDDEGEYSVYASDFAEPLL